MTSYDERLSDKTPLDSSDLVTQKCTCINHLAETILYEQLSCDFTSQCLLLKSWTLFGSEISDSTEDLLFFDMHFSEFESTYRIRGLRIILTENEKICSVEYSLTIMGMSGGDSKLRLRFCYYRLETKSQILITCEVEAPKESWFKKQIETKLISWATLCAKRATTGRPEQPLKRSSSWSRIMLYFSGFNIMTKEQITKISILVISFIVLVISYRFGSTYFAKDRLFSPITNIDNLSREYNNYMSKLSQQDDKASLEDALNRLTNILGVQDT